jgi:predicted nucleic acid-binding protein
MNRNRAKRFLDTNIFVYTFDQGAKRKSALAQKIVAESLANRLGVISYQVVQEFLNAATRKFAAPMRPPEAQMYLSQVLMPLCEIYPDASLYSHALTIAAKTGLSFYDSLIVSSAAAARCTLLLSEDLQHGRRIGDVEILNPFL